MTRPAPAFPLWTFRLAVLFTTITVTLGSVVCATRSGFDCPSWPGCYTDRFAPGPADVPQVLDANPVLEMVHRTIAMGTGGILLLAAIASLTLGAGWGRLVKVLPWVGVACAGVSALVGRQAVLGLPVPRWMSAADLLAALTAMTCLMFATVALYRGGGRFVRTPLSGLALTTGLTLFAMHGLALFAAGFRSYTRCMSWPILWLASDDSFGVQVVRSVLALAAVLLIVATVRAARLQPEFRGHAMLVAGLLLAVLVLTFLYRALAADHGVVGLLFSVASVALVWVVLFLAARSGIRRPASGSPVDAPLDGAGRLSRV